MTQRGLLNNAVKSAHLSSRHTSARQNSDAFGIAPTLHKVGTRFQPAEPYPEPVTPRVAFVPGKSTNSRRLHRLTDQLVPAQTLVAERPGGNSRTSSLIRRWPQDRQLDRVEIGMDMLDRTPTNPVVGLSQ